MSKKRWFGRLRSVLAEPEQPKLDPLTPAERAGLYEKFADDIGFLERLIDRDLSIWRPS